MEAFTLTYQELWALSSLLTLPLSAGSVLTQWLSAGSELSVEAIYDAQIKSLETLKQKGYLIETAEGLKPEVKLVACLAVLAKGERFISKTDSSRRQDMPENFVLEGGVLVRYLYTPDGLKVWETADAKPFLLSTFPKGLIRYDGPDSSYEMPLEAFYVLRQAMREARMNLLLHEGRDSCFSFDELRDGFYQDNVFMAELKQAGVEGAYDPTAIDLNLRLNQLLKYQYLVYDGERFGIGAAGETMFRCFADPALWTCTANLMQFGEELDRTFTLAYGGDCLMRMEFREKVLSYRFLKSWEEASASFLGAETAWV